MDLFKDGCHGSAAAIRAAAQRRLDNLISTPWYTDSKMTEDVARARHQINILKARNELSSAELLDIAHFCGVCSAATLPEPMHATCAMCPSPDGVTDATHKTCAVALSLGVMADFKAKQEKMEAIVAQILCRNALVKNLEDHLKTYGKIKKSLNIIMPLGNGMDYYYQINAKDGVSLVIRDSSRSPQAGPQPLNLIDAEILPPISAPVLAPISPPSASGLAPVSLEGSLGVKAPTEGEVEGEEEEATPISMPISQPAARTLQIWDSDMERRRAMRQYAGRSRASGMEQVPMMFHFGIQYQPQPGSPAAATSGKRSRMVIFSDLRPHTTWADVLARVGGGQVQRITQADAVTMFVYFVQGADARAYVRYVNGGHRVSVRGTTPSVTLAPSATYPVPMALMRRILVDGVTRRLALPEHNFDSYESLRKFLAKAKVRDFLATRELRVDEDSEDWVMVRDDDEVARNKEGTKKAPEMKKKEEDYWPKVVAAGMTAPPLKDTLYLSFRDISHAQIAHRYICQELPGCGVVYSRDRCDFPLEMLYRDFEN